ncbi:hypothetical protein MYAM1_001949 [Malassezia yamatoensis]|uniref:Uncharacterized protein n=1 Tax=Malassezia yamatoensis TaxID=253288 RepID=A0AAJ6CHC7_9BASI|nr:hypothetical protein MYAM1_001949 [Malassezia yamatoensis]
MADPTSGSEPVFLYHDTEEANAVEQQPKRAEHKEKNRRKRRMQLAAALIEADNDEIQRRIDFVVNVDPTSQELLDDTMLVPRYANQSVIFRDALDPSLSNQPYSRPVYVHTPQSMRELTQSYLGMTTAWGMDEPEDFQLIDTSNAEADQPSPVEEVTQNLLDLSMPSGDLQPELESSYKDLEDKAERRLALRSASSMPSLAEAARADGMEDVSLDTSQIQPETLTRHSLLLARIRKSRIVSNSNASEADITLESADADDGQNNQPSQESYQEPPVSHESNGSSGPVSGSASELQDFRARVLKNNLNRRRSSRRHSLAISGWPEENHPFQTESTSHQEHNVAFKSPFLAQSSGQNDSGLQNSDLSNDARQKQTEDAASQDIGPMLARHASAQQDDLTSAKWSRPKLKLRSLFPFERRQPARGHQGHERPTSDFQPSSIKSLTNVSKSILEEDSPVIGCGAIETFSTQEDYQDNEFEGVSLQTPLLEQNTDGKFAATSDVHQETRTETHLNANRLASFGSQRYQKPSSKERFHHICIPAPLEFVPRESPRTAFFVPHGAFYVDERGVVLPQNKTRSEAHHEYDYGPVEVPAKIGRRVLYPSTALFRNVLSYRDVDHEGWGYERYTNALSYFHSLHADDDDSDDEVPLMNVRIQTKEEQLARRRIYRERLRRKRARAERRRLRDLARRQGKNPSIFGITEESEDPSETSSEEYSSFSSGESDPEQPWKDYRRPAGKLYGRSLLDDARKQQEQNKSQIRFYGQVMDNQRHSAPPDGLTGFSNGTRERMEKVFGAQPRWMADILRRQEPDVESQTRSRSLGGTPMIGADQETDLLMEPGVQEGLIYPSIQTAREAEAQAAEEADDLAFSAWHDSSSSEDGEYQIDAQLVSLVPEQPKWQPKDDDDLPLNKIRKQDSILRGASAKEDSDDEQPLGNRHRQAAIIAENQALIRQLLEENRQVRASLQMLTSAVPYGMPWMPPFPVQFPNVPYLNNDGPLMGDVGYNTDSRPPEDLMASNSGDGYQMDDFGEARISDDLDGDLPLLSDANTPQELEYDYEDYPLQHHDALPEYRAQETEQNIGAYDDEGASHQPIIENQDPNVPIDHAHSFYDEQYPAMGQDYGQYPMAYFDDSNIVHSQNYMDTGEVWEAEPYEEMQNPYDADYTVQDNVMLDSYYVPPHPDMLADYAKDASNDQQWHSEPFMPRPDSDLCTHPDVHHANAAYINNDAISEWLAAPEEKIPNPSSLESYPTCMPDRNDDEHQSGTNNVEGMALIEHT